MDASLGDLMMMHHTPCVVTSQESLGDFFSVFKGSFTTTLVGEDDAFSFLTFVASKIRKRGGTIDFLNRSHLHFQLKNTENLCFFLLRGLTLVSLFLREEKRKKKKSERGGDIEFLGERKTTQHIKATICCQKNQNLSPRL